MIVNFMTFIVKNNIFILQNVLGMATRFLNTEICSLVVVARVLGLATPESILLANFWGEREESNL
jgi:hypothetical protein